ncbi:MAG: hypothetical protein KA010_04335 [Saprospiraceae bacterium]|nr:hypothetical protein [Saprospiraceae bacterium]
MTKVKAHQRTETGTSRTPYKEIDKKDSKQFYTILVGITIVLIVLMYFLFRNSF